MIKRNYIGSFEFSVNKASMSEKNIKMLKGLPLFIKEGHETYFDLHVQTIKDIIQSYGFLIEVNNHKYSFKDVANMIKGYYELTGKNKWYYDYLMAI